MSNIQFDSVQALMRWLDDKNWECESLEAFETWLHTFFNDGNTITVCGEEYDFITCWELV